MDGERKSKPFKRAFKFPTATYGCVSWAIKQYDARYITAFEHKCYRKILRVTWTQRRTNADMRNELEVPEGLLLNIVYRRKLKFFCHIKGHDSLELKAALEGKVPRKRGRQRRRWEDCISERLGYTTNEAGRLAQNRVLYRATVHAATSW